MEPNNKFIEMRKRLGPSQAQFAAKIGVARSTIADIERGSIGVSKRVRSKIVVKFKDEVGSFDGKKIDKNVENKEGHEVGLREGSEKNFNIQRKKISSHFSYIYRFRKVVDKNNPELSKMADDLIKILTMDEIIDSLHDSKIGNIVFFGVNNLQNVKSFKEFKDKWLQAYKEALPYKDMVKEYAEACRKFVNKLSEIKEEIKMDFDFEDWKQ